MFNLEEKAPKAGENVAQEEADKHTSACCRGSSSAECVMTLSTQCPLQFHILEEEMMTCYSHWKNDNVYP